MKNNPWLGRIIAPETREALAAIRKVGPDTALRAYNAAYADDAEKSFGETFGLTRSRGHVCLDRLLRNHHNHTAGCTMLPGSDHSSLWLLEGKPAVYATQPYGLDHDTIEQMVAVCRPRGLKLSIGGNSWYSMGATVLILVMPPWFGLHEARLRARYVQ